MEDINGLKTTLILTDKTSTFIQPSNLGISMNLDSWMQPRYEIDEFVYEFEEINNDQFLTFYSPESYSNNSWLYDKKRVFFNCIIIKRCLVCGYFYSNKKCQ